GNKAPWKRHPLGDGMVGLDSHRDVDHVQEDARNEENRERPDKQPNSLCGSGIGGQNPISARRRVRVVKIV
ncbi:MAG: hypothetical protein ACK55I_24390, partial [bacterium]